MVGAAGVLSFFAAAWWLWGVYLAGLQVPLFLAPLLTSVALFGVAWGKARRLPPRSAAEAARIGKLIGIWSAVEGVAIFIAVNIVANLGHKELIPVAVGIAVGLHFIPLARGIPTPGYYLSAALLLGAGALAILAPAILTPALFCLVAALILWGTVAALILTAKPTSSA